MWANVSHFQLFRAARTRTGGAVIDGRNRYLACQELGANQATHGWPAREDAHHIGAASDLLVETPALSPLIRGLQGRKDPAALGTPGQEPHQARRPRRLTL